MMVDSTSLTAANLLYRDPVMYDLMFIDSGHSDVVRSLVDVHAVDARTLIDFGCGTGRDIDALGDRFDCVGVEAQPGLVDHAAAVRRHVDVRLGDVCTIRLGQTADVLICLGNVLAYLHDDRALTAAFATFAAHAHAGTLLLIETMTNPPATRRVESPVSLHDRSAHVTVDNSYDEATGIATTRRTWTIDGREHAIDNLRRRVMSVAELDCRLAVAGFVPLPADHPGSSIITAVHGRGPDPHDIEQDAT